MRAARRIADARPDLTVFNIPVWSFPHFQMVAARETPGALTLFSSLDPKYPGMVGMLGGGGCARSGRSPLWPCLGRYRRPGCGGGAGVQIRAAAAVAALAGSTFGRIGGRPMGMYTAVANSDAWIQKFGVDVEEIDQWEIVRRSEAIDSGRVSMLAGGSSTTLPASTTTAPS